MAEAFEFIDAPAVGLQLGRDQALLFHLAERDVDAATREPTAS